MCVPEAKHRKKKATVAASSRASGLVRLLVVGLVTAYVTWVLCGTVAWVSHLGWRLPALGRALPAGGAPLNAPAGDVVDFFVRNVPNAALFVLPHSLLTPTRLRKVVGGRYGRLAYNLVAAVTLHLLLARFVPLETVVLMELDGVKTAHDLLSACLGAYAMASFVCHPATYSLLGAADALELEDWERPPVGMDAITWMAATTWAWGGPAAFVLFTGLSIIPARLTIGDCLTRGLAALYLRLRSRSFRKWVEQVESMHLLTWVLRAALLLAALRTAATAKDGGAESAFIAVGGGAALALILRVAESEAVRSYVGRSARASG